MKTISPVEVAGTVILVLTITNIILAMAFLELNELLRWYRRKYKITPRIEPAPPPGRLQQIICFLFQIRF